MNNYDYPCGTDEPNAPWNQADNPEREIEVTVSVTLSKTVKIKVSDYEITDSGKDEDGEYFEDIDYSNCDLNGAVENQVTLPQDLAVFVERMFNQDLNLKAAGMPKHLRNAIEDCKGWTVDDMEVISEE